ncbi:MAG: ABC transporter ATP-binding protein [Anaerolineae bacterium]
MKKNIAIEFDHVSKYFELGRTRSHSFQEILVGLFRRRERKEKFWVLRDVSLELEHGQTIGFIGANGAGKSTALKLISQIIEPNAGEIRTYGRIGALLELGAGFHPDLTGRENIYLNGSILGLDQSFIRSRFDEIVAFSELGNFIDVPVKHYSSGMYVRLGFSVAVHMDPEILLVDEVLAVGDAAFQHKCLDRISEMRREGITIVLVSHDLNSVESLCDRAYWFDEGRIAAQGDATDVVMTYLNAVAEEEDRKASALQESSQDGQRLKARHEENGRWGSRRVELTDVEFYNRDGDRSWIFFTGEPMEIRLHYQATEEVESPIFGLAIHHQDGTHVCGPNTQFGELEIPAVQGEGLVSYIIPSLELLAGTYFVSAAVVNDLNTEIYDYHDRLYKFRVFRGACRERYGMITMRGQWQIDNTEPPVADAINADASSGA